MSTSNTSILSVFHGARSAAQADFGYLCNHVLGCDVNKNLAVDVQALLEVRTNTVVPYSKPSILATAIITWLRLREINVLTSINVPRSEVCEWLGIDAMHSSSTCSATCCVELRQEGVQLTWL